MLVQGSHWRRDKKEERARKKDPVARIDCRRRKGRVKMRDERRERNL
jgi:hypothetical protein